MKKQFMTFAMLLASVVVLIACSSTGDDTPDQPQPQPQPQPQVYTITSEATMGNDVSRGTMIVDDTKLKFNWASSDVVYVKNKADGKTGTGTMTPQTVDSHTTTLRGTLTGDFAVGDELEMTTLSGSGSFNYAGQKGTLADIGENFAYATATVTVSSIRGASITTTRATFSSQQAIVKFTLLGEAGEPLTATSFTVEGCGTPVTVPPVTVSDFSSSKVYVAMPGISNGWMRLTATVGDDTYSYETGHITYEIGKHYTTIVRMAKHESMAANQPLTIQALKGGTTVTFKNQAVGDVQYSTDGNDWTVIAAKSVGNVTLANAGDKVYFQGSNASYYPGDEQPCISFTQACYVYGNIMSLANGQSDNLADAAFMNLFYGNENLRSHPTKRLGLTAKKLPSNCYNSMFHGCTGMVKGPEFATPTSRGEACYAYMFSGCSSLNYVEYKDSYAVDLFSQWLDDVATNGTFVTSSDNKSDWETQKGAGSHPVIPSGWTVTVE